MRLRLTRCMGSIVQWGSRPSRLTWVCFVCGMTGALGMLWFEHWSASVDWALNVGGKPWNSLPSDVPVAFEAAVLLAGLRIGVCVAGRCRLYPGKATSHCKSPRHGRSVCARDQWRNERRV